MARSEADDLFDAAAPSEADALFEAAAPAEDVTGRPPSRGSFLDYLKAKWSGEKDSDALPEGVRTVQTPTGPTHLTAAGAPFYAPDEADQMQAGNAARFKQRVLEGGLSTLSGGGKLMDEMSGARKVPGAIDQWASDKAFGRPTTSPLDVYRKERNSVRRDVASATANASPQVGGVDVLPLVGAAIPSLFAPIPATWGARVLGGGLASMVDELGGSESDLTRGEVAQFGGDLGNAAKWGAGASGVAELVTAPMRMIGRGAAPRVANEVLGQTERDVNQVGKEVKHLQGVANAETQKGSRMTENILRHANGLTPEPGMMVDSEQFKSLAATQEPWFKELADEVAANTRARGPAQKAVIDAARAEASSAATSAAEDASNRTRDYFKQSTWGTQIQPRLTTLAENGVLGGAAGAATGGASGLIHGGLESLADGVISGFGGSALSGGSGLKTLAKNAMSSPLVRVSALNGLESAANTAAGAFQRTARTAPILTNTAGDNAKKAQQTAFQALAERFGINAKSKEELANEAFVKSQSGALPPGGL